ncbi:unnamed protein product [Schistosoma mattheei]|uniref:Secreted protein n=1 Tax=Schistosoma mattheei TaxID=31246 RepID=A0A3P8FS62_9TREM|nr:unnamed protein product [Schistosoma mattheei]
MRESVLFEFVVTILFSSLSNSFSFPLCSLDSGEMRLSLDFEIVSLSSNSDDELIKFFTSANDLSDKIDSNKLTAFIA